MKISVIGAGRVGLVTAVGFWKLGHSVQVGEIDPARVEGLRRGHVPFHEPELADLLAEALQSRDLTFSESNPQAVMGTAAVFIAVSTSERSDGSADIGSIEAVVEEILSSMTPGSVVVCRSTVPVGTAKTLAEKARVGGIDVGIVSNPEFFREGTAVADFLNPDRIVIGSEDSRAAELIDHLYEDIDAPRLITAPESAEMIKYGSNAYLATRVSFVNEIAGICEAAGTDVEDVLLGIRLDPRIGSDFFRPGPGFGGSCLPKDTRALIAIGRATDREPTLLKATLRVNEEQLTHALEKVLTAAGGSLEGKVVGLLGLTFKPGVDDTREAPAVALAELLRQKGATVRAYDPMAGPVNGSLDRVDDLLDAAKEADVLVIATAWSEFGDFDVGAAAESMRGSGIVDLCNIIDPVRVREAGLTYW